MLCRHADLSTLAAGLAGHRRLSQAFLLASAEFFQACPALGGKVELGLGTVCGFRAGRRIGERPTRSKSLITPALDLLLEAALLGGFLEFLPYRAQRRPADGNDDDEEIQPVAHVGKSIQSG